MKIALYGFMGAGKSTLGKALAERLAYVFVDLDKAIEQKSGKSINEIFDKEGEIAFRRLEHQVLKDIVKQADENIVLALGGGTILAPQNRKLLEIKNFDKLYLKLPVEELIKRLKKDNENRPLLKNLKQDEFEDYVRALFESRKNQYEAYADLVITIGTEDFDTVLNRLYLQYNLN